MRIPEALTSEAAAAQARRTETEAAPRSGGAEVQSGGGGDEVLLSRLSDTLRAAASADPPGRPERIARLASEYASGRYTVDATALSRALVEGALAGD